jgi:hypothetical protein
VETLNENLAKGMPFIMKPLRMIEIDDVEVSKEMPTLTIKDKSKITTRKATIEEVPDEEALTLVANQQPISDAIIKEIPPLVINSEDSNEEPLKVVTLELDEIEEDKMIIAYIKGEPIISIFEKKDTPLTKEHDYPKYDYAKNNLGIQQISTSIRSARYTFGQDA